MVRILIVLTAALTIVACKKESFEPTKLEGDLAFLVGEWEWQYTIHNYSTCNEFINEVDTLDPENTLTNHGIEFTEEGQVLFIKNNVVESQHNIFVKHYGDIDSTTIFTIYPSNKEALALVGIWYDPINLVIFDYPYQYAGCSTFANYFKKE